MQNVLTRETDQYAICINNFEGPVDLLCHLIDKNKMNICDIKISEITDQYIDYLNQMDKLNLEIASEFVVMASTLVFLKSKTLLPKQVEEEQELSEEELIQRIIEYKKYKEITKKLKEQYAIFSKQCFKKPENIELPKQKLDKKYESILLVKIYTEIVEKSANRLNQNARNIEKIALTESYTVGSKVKTMFRELIAKKKFVFNKLFSLSICQKAEVVTAFTGLLELSRRNKVITKQDMLFGNIQVEKRKKDN